MSALTSQTVDFFGRWGMTSLSLSFVSRTQAGLIPTVLLLPVTSAIGRRRKHGKPPNTSENYVIWADAQDHLPIDTFPRYYCSPTVLILLLPNEGAHWKAHQLNEFNKGGLGLNRWSLKGRLGQNQPAKQTNLSAWSSPSPSIHFNWLNYPCISVENAAVILKLQVTTLESHSSSHGCIYQPRYKYCIHCLTHTHTQRASL